MVTVTTIDNLQKKASTDLEKRAVEELKRHLSSYTSAKSETKSIKLGSGYKTSSEHDAYRKAKFRNENTIKTLKRFLDQVGWNKSKKAIFYYIINGPTGSVDYYHGLSREWSSYDDSAWKKSIIYKAFKGRLS
jgi:hypothetical protein